MLKTELFHFSPTALLAIDPKNNRVIQSNLESCHLLKEELHKILTLKPTSIFADCLPEFIVFTQELIELGRAWSDSLSVKLDSGFIDVEIKAKSIQWDGQNIMLMAIQTCEELDSLRGEADANRHYKSGFSHWQRAARVFQEFERENQLLLEAAGEGIYGVDAQGITTFVNPAAERILEYSADELAGKNMHSTVHHSHANGSCFKVDLCPIYKAFKEGEVQRVEGDIFWSKSGRAIDVDYTSTPIYDEGEIVGAVVIFRDISQKKIAEKKLKNALQEVEHLKHKLELENAYLQEELSSEFNNHKIIGKSNAIKNTIQQLEMVAPTEATVLINGESGTGKELIARAIHEMSPRSNRSLIRVNCAAIPDELFESEFFGHIKGAFSGAYNDRVGRFELADGGTIFLDEVGEIPLQQQSKLLRVLQEQQFERIGDEKTRHVNVRIIAATNRDLKAEVDAGKFREDLYFRLNVFPIESLPLRKRKEDIPLLTQHFLEKFITKFNKPNLRLPMSEMEKLSQYHWPGNVRELENIIERQVILAQNNMLRFQSLTEARSEPIEKQNKESATNMSKLMTELDLKALDRDNIIKALQLSNGKVSGGNGAAELLGLKTTTLESRIRKYNIDKRVFH